MKELRLFAYGTLMFPEVAARVAGLEQVGEGAVLHNFERLTVNNPEYRYVPAIIAREGASVAGKLLRSVLPNQWIRLDEFEEVDSGLYTRIETIVTSDSGRREACFTYVAGEKISGQLGGPWYPSEFEKRYLRSYIGALGQ